MPPHVAGLPAYPPEPGQALTLGEMLPGYPAYARVLNPVLSQDGRTFRWADVAGPAAVVNASTQWADIAGAAREPRIHGEPEQGTLEPRTAAELAAVLQPFTATRQDCSFLVWEGTAGLRRDVVTAATVLVAMDRRMYVLKGSVEDAVDTVGSRAVRLPLWWLPADGSWCVCGDVMGRSVFVGGSGVALAAVLADRQLEACPASAGVVLRPGL